MHDHADVAAETMNLRAAISYINNGYALVPLWSSERVSGWNLEHPDAKRTTKVPVLKHWQHDPISTRTCARRRWESSRPPWMGETSKRR